MLLRREWRRFTIWSAHREGHTTRGDREPGQGAGSHFWHYSPTHVCSDSQVVAKPSLPCKKKCGPWALIKVRRGNKYAAVESRLSVLSIPQFWEQLGMCMGWAHASSVLLNQEPCLPILISGSRDQMYSLTPPVHWDQPHLLRSQYIFGIGPQSL